MPNFTRRAIKESFLKLLNQRPLNQITVKDIVEDCGINRNSFYYHFSDLPALVEEIMAEQVSAMVENHPTVELPDAPEVIADIVLHAAVEPVDNAAEAGAPVEAQNGGPVHRPARPLGGDDRPGAGRGYGGLRRGEAGGVLFPGPVPAGVPVRSGVRHPAHRPGGDRARMASRSASSTSSSIPSKYVVTTYRQTSIKCRSNTSLHFQMPGPVLYFDL